MKVHLIKITLIIGGSESKGKKLKLKQISTVPIQQHWNAFHDKKVLNCEEAPGVPKAFLGFLKKKCSQS